MQASKSLTELQFSAGQRGMIEIPSQRIRDSLGLLFDITPLSTDLNSGIHRSRNWYANQCIFTQLEADAFAVRRTKDQIQNGEHLVFVHRYLDGYLRGRIGDLNIDREPGFIYLLDQASDVECVQRPAIMQTVIIPKSALGFDPDAHPPLIKFSVEHGLGRVINTLFDSVFDGLLNRNAVEFSDFNQLIACLRLGLGAPEIDDVGDVRTLARQAIQGSIATYVEQRLDQWSLDVSTILKDFGVSRASLYRMFEDRGGVRQYISDRRLLRAVLDISKGPIQRGEISEAAERWGFSSAANFNRAIRREFGVTPGALIALPEDDPQSLTLRKDLRAFREVADESVERIARPKLLVPV